MAKKEKQPNYSAEDIDYMLETYDPEDTQENRDNQVQEIADSLGRKKQSVIAKLVNLKVYVKKEYQSKTGEKAETKEVRVNKIAESLGVAHELMDSLAKANVSVIKMFADTVERKNTAEKNLEAVLQAAQDAGVSVELPTNSE